MLDLRHVSGARLVAAFIKLTILGEALMKQHILCGAACAGLLVAASGTAHAVAVSGQGTWEYTLEGRSLDGDPNTFEAYYDTVLDITWLRDANFARTRLYDPDGRMLWRRANTWAGGLDLDGVAGPDGWRLPTIVDVGNDGCTTPNADQGLDCGYNITAHSEMSHMFYVTLGNKSHVSPSGDPQPDYGLINTGPFYNMQSVTRYWTATGYRSDSPYSDLAWTFNFDNGGQGFQMTNGAFYAWAVYDGDIGAQSVPVPAAAWLLAGGLGVLVGGGRRRRS